MQAICVKFLILQSLIPSAEKQYVDPKVKLASMDLNDLHNDEEEEKAAREIHEANIDYDQIDDCCFL